MDIFGFIKRFIKSIFWLPEKKEVLSKEPSYKIKYIDESLQAKLIKLRRDIKKRAAETTILKQELRHFTRAKKPLGENVSTELLETTREQRSRFLAYGFLRNKRYSEVEEKPKWKKFPNMLQPNWDRIADLTFQYGNSEENLMSLEEVRKAKQKLLDRLKKWVEN